MQVTAEAKFNVVVRDDIVDNPAQRDAFVARVAALLPKAKLHTNLLEFGGILAIDCDTSAAALLESIDGVEAIERDQLQSKRA
jgi:hypothetical protein